MRSTPGMRCRLPESQSGLRRIWIAVICFRFGCRRAIMIERNIPIDYQLSEPDHGTPLQLKVARSFGLIQDFHYLQLAQPAGSRQFNDVSDLLSEKGDGDWGQH